MKTKITGYLIALFAMLSFTETKAQCVDVDNQLNCPITVQITLYFSCGTPLVPCNTMPITMNLPALSGPVSVNCTACSAPCDIRVTLVKANGVSIPTSSATFATGLPGPSSSCPAACGPQANIYYDNVNNAFTVY